MRIECRSRAILVRRSALLDRLLDHEAYDTIRALVLGRLTWADVLQADREGRLTLALERLVLRTELLAAARRVFDPGRATEARYLRSLARLVRHMEAEGLRAPTIEQLARAPWGEWARRWPATGTDWNHLRRAVSRLLSVVLTKGHPFWLELRGRIPILREHVHMPVVTLPQLGTVLERLPAELAIAARVAVVSGMRPAELARWRPSWLATDGYVLHIDGTKTRESQRSLAIDPRWWGLFPGTGRLPVDRLSRALGPACRAAGVEPLQVRSFRHLAGQWMEKAGIEPGVIMSALGHTPWQPNARYRRAPWTAEHAARYATFLAPLLPPAGLVLPLRRKEA